MSGNNIFQNRQTNWEKFREKSGTGYVIAISTDVPQIIFLLSKLEGIATGTLTFINRNNYIFKRLESDPFPIIQNSEITSKNYVLSRGSTRTFHKRDHAFSFKDKDQATSGNSSSSSPPDVPRFGVPLVPTVTPS